MRSSHRSGISEIVAAVLLLVVVITLATVLVMLTTRYVPREIGELTITRVEVISERNILMHVSVRTSTTCTTIAARAIAVGGFGYGYLFLSTGTVPQKIDGQATFDVAYSIPKTAAFTTNDVVIIMYAMDVDCGGAVYTLSDATFLG